MNEHPQRSVIAFAAFVLVLVLLSAYCTDRDGGSFGGDFDELVLQNPPYMLANFGKLSFYQEPVVAHPPIHVGFIGVLMRLGFSIYYAEATPTVLLLLLAAAAIVRSRFPALVKLGLLFSIGFLGATGETLTLCFGTRPEGEVHAAWFMGLILLESGRLDGWNRWRMSGGAFFLTWASGVHYYAAAAFTGVAVYAVWAMWTLGWHAGRSRLAAMAAGGCLFGIPYLAFFVIPRSAEIHALVSGFQGPGGPGLALTRHLALYREWAHSADHPAVVRLAMATGAPLVVFSTAILAAIPAVRGLALAALPLQLVILLFSLHKPPFYLVHECILFATALALGTLVCAERICAGRRGLERFLAPLAAGLLSVSLLWGNAVLPRATLSLKPKVHEAALARAASREILGPGARVGGREAGWYVSGASYWLHIEQDFVPNRLLYDLRSYFSNLDAIVDFSNNSQGPLTTWYADGSLHLRGFYFGESSEQLRLVYLSGTRASRIVGFVAHNGRLERFEEEPSGDHAVLSAVCPPDGTSWLRPYRSTASSILRFGSDSPDAAREMITILAPLASMAPAGPIGRSCREVSRVVGTLKPADKDMMLASLKNDRPIHFFEIVDQMPGFSGIGIPASFRPPAEAVAVAGVLDLATAVAASAGRVTRTEVLRIWTVPGFGSFSAFIPVSHPESVKAPCWVTLRLRVLAGHVGFAAIDSRKGLILARTPQIAGSPEPQTIALEVTDLTTATHVVIFNESPLTSGGLVEVWNAEVLVKPQGSLPGPGRRVAR